MADNINAVNFLIYNSNSKVKSYVDKYCFKHEKTAQEAVKDKIVQLYIDEVLENVRH